jgi:hypothetical protein
MSGDFYAHLEESGLVVWSLKRHVTFYDPYKIAVPPLPPNSSPPLTKGKNQKVKKRAEKKETAINYLGV